MSTQTTTLASWLLDQVAADETEAESYPAAWRARVLAHCAAKRRIVELHTPEYPGTEMFPRRCPICDSGDGEDYYVNNTELDPCPTLRALASPYADREGFDPAWLA